jgi:hypothetical protein
MWRKKHRANNPIVIIHIFKPKESVIELPVDSGETSAEPFGHAQASHQLAVLRFDYWLAFASMLCFLVAYVGLCLAPTGTLFTIASAAVATGGGLGPAAQSILLGLYSARVGAAEESAHAGALLGALGVLVALVSQVRSCTTLCITALSTHTGSESSASRHNLCQDGRASASSEILGVPCTTACL